MTVYNQKIQVLISEEMLTELKRLAKHDERSLSDYVRVLLKDHLNDNK